MRIFYKEWQCLSIGSPMANQLQQLENKIEEGIEIGEKNAHRRLSPFKEISGHLFHHLRIICIVGIRI
jgi:hypothetical protein